MYDVGPTCLKVKGCDVMSVGVGVGSTSLQNVVEAILTPASITSVFVEVTASLRS